VFSKRIIGKHSISLRQLAIGDLNLRERIKITVIAFAICCGFFLFAQYNARGELKQWERSLLIVVGALGSSLIFIVNLWEFKVMERETEELEEAEEEEEEAEGVGEAEEMASRPVEKLHWGFQATGLIASCTHTMWSILEAGIGDETFMLIKFILLPFVTFFVISAFISDPKSGKKRFEVILFLTFASASVPEFTLDIRDGNAERAVFVFVTKLIGYSVMVHYGFKFREKVTALSPKALSKFLLESVLKNAMQNISGMLFVTFRVLNCVMEETLLEKCANKIY